MAKKRNKIVFIPLYILLASILVVSLFISKNQETRTRAASLEEEFRNCITPPKCCYDIVQTGDAFSCPTPWGVDGDGRGWCPPSMCAAIQGKGQRCGWYWLFHDEKDTPGIGTNTPTGYGCMIGDSEATMKMKFNPDGTLISYPSAVTPTVQPTKVPRPTEIVLPTSPQPTPTEIVLPPTNSPVPTQILEPTQIQRPAQPVVTYIPIVLPTNRPQPTVTPTPTPFKFTLPNILPPKEKVDSFFTSVKTNLLDFLSKILP